MKARIAPDTLFTALDGTQVSVAGLDWRVEVFSVIDEPGQRWIQLALQGVVRRIVTVRANHTESPRQIVREISSWLADPSAARNILQRVA